MSVLIWTLYTDNITDWDGTLKPAPFVSFIKPGATLESSFQIGKAQILKSSGYRWRFFPTTNGADEPRPLIFVLSDRVRYRPWPTDILSQGIVHAFLVDNKVLSN